MTHPVMTLADSIRWYKQRVKYRNCQVGYAASQPERDFLNGLYARQKAGEV